jgi:hypothetical protein
MVSGGVPFEIEESKFQVENNRTEVCNLRSVICHSERSEDNRG